MNIATLEDRNWEGEYGIAYLSTCCSSLTMAVTVTRMGVNRRNCLPTNFLTAVAVLRDIAQGEAVRLRDFDRDMADGALSWCSSTV